MYLIQTILLLFCLVSLVKVISRYRARDISAAWMMFWSGFWVLAAIAALWPDSTMYLARLLGVGRGADVVVYLALALLFFLFFKITVKLEIINKNLTKIARAVALREGKNDSDLST